MDILHRCCAGLDVHKKTVVACVRRVGPDGTVSREVRTFGTMTAELLALADWLEAQGVTPRRHGIDRRLLEAGLQPAGGPFEVILVNAQHIKQVPGRKTDVKDAQWIAQLLQHGLLSRQLRAAAADPRAARPDAAADPARPRRATVANRIQKVLEDANIKLAQRGHRRPGRVGPRHDRGR